MNGETIWVSYYDELFLDELSISLLEGIRERGEIIDGYYDEKDNPISEKEAVQWVLTKYFDKVEMCKWCEKRNRSYIKEEQLYEIDDEYKRIVDEGRIYILHLMGVEKKKIAEYFDVSRQTIYKRIRDFEKSR